MKEIERRRTFAIISHPDAGKTTLTEEDNRSRVNSPNHLTLVHWVDVVHLNAYVSGRTWSIKDIEFYVLSLAESI